MVFKDSHRNTINKQAHVPTHAFTGTKLYFRYNIAHDKRLHPQGCFHLPDFPMILAQEAFSKTVKENSHSSLSCYLSLTRSITALKLPERNSCQCVFFPFPQLPDVTAALKFPLFALYLRNIVLKLCFTSAESPCLSVCMPFHIFIPLRLTHPLQVSSNS